MHVFICEEEGRVALKTVTCFMLLGTRTAAEADILFLLVSCVIRPCYFACVRLEGGEQDAA